MTGKLITLPLRLYIRAAGMVLHGAQQAAGTAVSLAEQVVQSVIPDGGHPHEGPPAVTQAPRRGAEPPRGAAAADPRRQPAAQPVRVEPPPPDTESRPQPRVRSSAAEAGTPAETAEPAHVSEEAELVEEFAEPGAEEGAGVEVRIDEPWPGYAQMNAQEVIARVNGASAAELAAVQLYENSNRRRQTVISAVQRQLRTINGGGSPE